MNNGETCIYGVWAQTGSHDTLLEQQALDPTAIKEAVLKHYNIGDTFTLQRGVHGESGWKYKITGFYPCYVQTEIQHDRVHYKESFDYYDMYLAMHGKLVFGRNKNEF